MYYILFDIHHISQLKQIMPETVAELRNTLIQDCDRWGFTPVDHPDLYLFKHPQLSPGEHEPLIRAIFQARDDLTGYDDDLNGYSIIVEAVDDGDDIFSIIPALTGSLRERNGLYLGPKASKLLSRALIGEQYRGLWKIIDKREREDQDLGTASDFAISREFMETLFNTIEEWMNGEKSPGELRISGTETQGIHLLGRKIIQRLTNPDAQGKIPFQVIQQPGDFFPSLVASLDISDLSWVQPFLNETERMVWREKLFSITRYRLDPELGRRDIPRPPEEPWNDMQIIFQIYLRAYARWARGGGNSPLVIIHFRREMADWELRFLKLLMDSLQRESRLLWFLTGEPEFLPSQDLSRDCRKLQLESHSQSDVTRLIREQNLDDSPLEPSYLMSMTRGDALPLFHFINDFEYYSQLLPSRLKTYGSQMVDTRTGIMLRALERLDFENREVLYVLTLAGTCFSREQLFKLFEERGKTRTRVTQIIKDLQASGFLIYEQIHNTVFQDSLQHIAYTLGDVKQEYINKIVSALSNGTNGIPLTEDGIAILVEYSLRQRNGNPAPQLYRHLQTLLNCKLYVEFRRLISMLEHRPNFSDPARLLKAQYALDRGEFHKGLIPSEYPENLLWKAEWQLLQSLAFLKEREFQHAKQYSKEAIISFQQQEDSPGLSSANTVFGYLHLRQRKHQEAFHYFTIAERHAGVSPNDLNRMYARFLPALSDFTEGKYSRVRKELEGEEGLLAQFAGNAAHSWYAVAAFLISRTYFALGLYEKCYTLLSRILNSLSGDRWVQIRRVFYAWMARSLNYMGSYEAGRAILENLPQSLETNLFYAESCIIRGEFEDALDRLKEPGAEGEMQYPTSILFPWNSGFSWVEDMFVDDLSQDSVLWNLYYGMRSYAQGMMGETEESIRGFHWLTRQKKILSSDPHESTILYWYAGILERSREDEGEDRLTLLGKAVKALQERSSRIEEPADKREYLKNVVWNRELLEKAKRHNLV
ncbi:hypothetical protein [Salinispira pacifica]|uniref:MalT-like TPR region domain-containing protein n=1 Tax=Salinispira pacifica TaxID=1307761 RepID=V5WIS3_9SPIO|nr:hypothetical protein [Salinispira pacifica]AHC15046.1 hypothetical protein L21SP2_1661 [Salinispira pacifica]